MSLILSNLMELSDAFFNTFSFLIYGFLFALIIWFAQFRWRRRKMIFLASKIPGPYPLPVIGNAHLILGTAPQIFHGLYKNAKDYPGLAKLWLGHKLLIQISDPTYAEVVLNQCLNKSNLMEDLKRGVGNGLFTAEATLWKKNRKTLFPTFNPKILDDFVEIFSQNAVSLTERIDKEIEKGKIDIYELIFETTINISCETSMGMEACERLEDVGRSIDGMLEIAIVRMFSIFYQCQPLFLLTQLNKNVEEHISRFHTFTRKVINRKKAEFEKTMADKALEPEAFVEKERKAFLDLLMELLHKNQISDQQIEDEVNTFIIAGSGTTAVTISFSLVTLGMFPEIQQKVYDEVVSVLGLYREVQPEDLPKLKYTERFIKETLRLFPVAPFTLREVERDTQVGSYTLPAGSSVMTCVYRIHTDPKNYPDPYKFDPDRFLPEESSKRHPYSYLAFSAGVRNCIGMKFGYMVLKTAIATLIRKYRCYCDYKKIEDIQLESILTIKPTDGYKVTLKPRM